MRNADNPNLEAEIPIGHGQGGPGVATDDTKEVILSEYGLKVNFLRNADNRNLETEIPIEHGQGGPDVATDHSKRSLFT